MFHTQERRFLTLSTPIQTTNPNAWLGDGYYFWYDEDDAHWWGQTAKKTRYYEIYLAKIDCENVLDTVFNEEHYLFWLKQIRKAISTLLKGNRNKVTIKDINDKFKESGLFNDVDGVMFQDISDNPHNWFVKEFQYKKRIQIAVYKLNIITNFALYYDSKD